MVTNKFYFFVVHGESPQIPLKKYLIMRPVA